MCHAAINVEKDRIEGAFRTSQTVWGLVMDTETKRVHLPEKRIQKGADLLADGAFDYTPVEAATEVQGDHDGLGVSAQRPEQ